MAEIEAKVNMSLDDIIKMEKKKKGSQRGGGRGRGGGGGERGGRGGINNRNMRGGGGPRGNYRGGNTRGRGGYNNRGGHMNNYNNRNTNNYNNNYYNNNRNNNMNNRRGMGGAPYRRFQQNGVRGGFVQKRYNNAPVVQNLRRSRSSVSLNRMSYNGSGAVGGGGGYSRRSYSPYRGGGGGGGGGRFRSRSRSRSNIRYQDMSYQNNSYESPSQSFLQRTNSLPDLRDDASVYDRLGYQNSAQVAYRNRVKRTTRNNNSNNHINAFINSVYQRQNKNMKMQNALQLSPSAKSMQAQQPLRQRRYSSGSVRSEQLLRAQRRAQYEQKLMRINSSRANVEPLDYMSSLNEYVSKQHPALALRASQNSLNARQLRARSPYTQSLIVPKTEPKSPRRPPQRRARSRSRSRARNSTQRNSSVISLSNDLEDRSFSEVMYSLSNNFGVTGRTLNDRFSL